MAGERSRLICSRVEGKLLRLGTPVEQDYIYDILNRIQNRICEEASALEYKYTVNITAGQTLYDYPDGFIVERVVNPTAEEGLSKIGIEDVIAVQAAENITDTELSYYYKFNNQLGFITGGGNAPSVAATVYLYGWRRPKQDKTENISRDIDPIVDSRWDTCFEYGAIALVADDPKFLTLYETEFQRQQSLENVWKDYSFFIPSNRDYD